MKPISDTTIEEFEKVALEGVKKLREYFKYEGTDTRYFQKAKIAATAIAAYTRVRASESNRMGIELVASRLGMGLPNPPALVGSGSTEKARK